jgi:hypothetical protein
MSKNINIPMVTDLVAAGDPRLKANAQKMYSTPSHIDELNMRIDEIENTIGQDNSGPIGRAFAIRAETNVSITDNAQNKKIKPKNINLKSST